MPALAITQEDADRSEAAKLEAITIMKDGAAVGGSSVIAAMPGLAATADANLNPARSMVEAIAVAVVRLSKNGATKFPVLLPHYTVFALPSAGDHTGCLVYVVNGAAGAAVVAFSDGSNWLRVDTRTGVSSS